MIALEGSEIINATIIGTRNTDINKFELIENIFLTFGRQKPRMRDVHPSVLR